MKRRTFIKGLAAAILSPFIASRTHTPEATIPDPVRTPAEEAFAERHVLYPDALEMSHIEDSMRYAVVMDREYWKGDQWSASEIRRIASRQRELNIHRSTMINKIRRIKYRG